MFYLFYGFMVPDLILISTLPGATSQGRRMTGFARSAKNKRKKPGSGNLLRNSNIKLR